MKAILADSFRDRLEQTGMSQAAIAKAIGVSPQYFNRVYRGLQPPSVRFITGAIQAGLGDNFSDIAKPTDKIAS